MGPTLSKAPKADDSAGSADTSRSGGADDSSRNAGLIPTTFTWANGGTEVFVVGSFSNWQKKIPLQRTGAAELVAVVDLAPGKYEYKFVVDGEWRCCNLQTITKDNLGNENNCLEVKPQEAHTTDRSKEGAVDESKQRPASPLSSYTSEIDPNEDYSKEPPQLPPHLKLSLLNHAPWRNDPNLLPVPQHVTVNHLYTAPSVDGVMVMGVTNRFHNKFVTTVMYTCA